MKTVLIENDHRTGEYIKLAFQVGWPDIELLLSGHGDEGLALIEKEYPDIVIIDYSVSDTCCCELLKQIRLFSSVPIIIISDRVDELKIVEALECGADEFVNKPVGQMELLARIRALLRRQKPPRVELPYICGPFCLYPSSGQLSYKNRSTNLTRTESLILLHLMKNADRIVSYSSLADTLWGAEYPGSIDAIRVYVNRLKEKVRIHFGHSDLIKNKPGIGYLLIKS